LLFEISGKFNQFSASLATQPSSTTTVDLGKSLTTENSLTMDIDNESTSIKTMVLGVKFYIKNAFNSIL